ncbi:MAG: polysaccharide lyase [Sedimentisphaerales bacterium]|nr:polysaccharide lyase [Sedimentisphaerales bacterium]
MLRSQQEETFASRVNRSRLCSARRLRRHQSPLIALIVVFTSASWAARGPDPISLHRDNPHYFLWRGEPTILITSGEHYGAVLNQAFDCAKYLQTLQSNGFNLTRTFSGAYCEPQGAFGIEANTLAPAKGDLLCPWARNDTPGYANGGNKFDLSRWDAAYFTRLTNFVTQAAKRGIVVEMVFFCPFYENEMWELSPMNARNNINGIGDVEREEVYTLKHKDLLAVQDAMVRRIVGTLRDFDNVYYEICNEPYFGGVTVEWQNHIAETIVQAESAFVHKHLIAQNIANKTKRVEDPNPRVSIFNFHYAKPPAAVADNYHLNRAVGDDETGFAGGDRAKPYRLEGWDFIIAGGAVFDNLDYSFAVGHEDGTAKINAPGGGGPELRRQLQVLREFIDSFDFIKMKPDDSVIEGGVPTGATARALVQPGRAYAIYVNGNGIAELTIDLPQGSYKAEWVNTKTGNVEKAESFEHDGGSRALAAPTYSDDVALRLTRAERQRRGLLFESDFENGNLEGWQPSGNTPAIVQGPARSGKHAMRTSLDRQKDRFSYRTEVSGPRAEIGKEYWYGFSILLPEDYAPDHIWEIVAQWHGVPDFDAGENWRNPVMALSTTNGHWGWVSRWDAKRNTFESGMREYGGTHNYDLGPYQKGVWTDWVVHVKWSYRQDGLLQVWKDGVKVIDQDGPNAFNDKDGPFFKMGLYKGWSDPNRRSDKVSKRVLYHDEFRMGGSEAGYEDVAPGP